MNNSDQKWRYQLFYSSVQSFPGMKAPLSSLRSSLVFVISQPSSDSPYSSGFFLKMQLEIMTLQSLQPWYHGMGELQCVEQKNKHFRGVKKKKKRQRKSVCKFCGREERNRDGSGRKQLSGCFTHLLKPHMYQLRLTSISTTYSYLTYTYIARNSK